MAFGLILALTTGAVLAVDHLIGHDSFGTLTDPLARGETGTVEDFASDDPPDHPPLGGKWHVKVTGVRDPLPGASALPGARMVGIYVEVRNVWNHTAPMGVFGDLYTDRNLNARRRPAAKPRWRLDEGSDIAETDKPQPTCSNGPLRSPPVKPGANRRVCIAFSVPNGARPAVLDANPGISGRETYLSLR